MKPAKLSEADVQWLASAVTAESLDDLLGEEGPPSVAAAAIELLAARKVVDAAEAYRAVPALKNPEQAEELLAALDLALLEYRLAVGDD
jgi:uroporphyrinogen-III synthase